MQCESCRELVSADLDGEVNPLEQAAMQSHLSTCESCASFATTAGELHRTSRIAPAMPVPDLTASIIAAAPSFGSSPATDASSLREPAPLVTFLRYALGVVAATQLVLALPELFQRAAGADTLHTVRHLGAWDLAFAVGMLVVALQPWRARGLLPMAAALAGVMAITAGIDLAGGHAAGVAEATHLLEITGLLVLWQLARTQTTGRSPSGRHRGSGRPSGSKQATGRVSLDRRPSGRGPATAHGPDRTAGAPSRAA